MLLIGEGKEVSETLDSNTHTFPSKASYFFEGGILCSPLGQSFLSVKGKRSQIPWIATHSPFRIISNLFSQRIFNNSVTNRKLFDLLNMVV
jgi:hypothetical protein